MYQHEYLIVKDIDEVVVPQSRANNWQEMLRNVEVKILNDFLL